MSDSTYSPDGTIRVDWSVNTGRMSHEIWSPRAVVAATEEVLFDLRDGDIDASVDWLADGTFRMRLRRYSRESARLDLWVDVPGRVFRAGAGPGEGEVLPIEQAQHVILGGL